MHQNAQNASFQKLCWTNNRSRAEHSHRYDVAMTNIDATRRGPRVMPPVYLLAAILAMLLLHRLIPVYQWLAGPWRRIGWLVIIAGLAIGVATVRLFFRHKTAIRPGQVSTRLMTDGLFRFTRNPIYIGMTIILIGEAILLGSLTPLLAIPAFIWCIQVNIIPVEEAMLTEVFGEEYRQYQQRVRRWI
jgi:protein-S-isoprenylcysteine O-methyltransferase Ste14